MSYPENPSEAAFCFKEMPAATVGLVPSRCAYK